MNDPLTFKILLIGDSGTGKSSLLLRFTDDTFLEEEMSATIGVDFKVKYIQTPKDKIKLTIWDTAGQERFRTLTSSYYRGAQGVILVYDVTRRSSFENLSTIWLQELQTYSTSKDVIKMIVGNKVDNELERKISTEEGMQFAQKHGALFIECSSKTKIGVEQAFEELCYTINETPSLWQKRSTENVQLNATNEDEYSFCSC